MLSTWQRPFAEFLLSRLQAMTGQRAVTDRSVNVDLEDAEELNSPACSTWETEVV